LAQFSILPLLDSQLEPIFHRFHRRNGLRCILITILALPFPPLAANPFKRLHPHPPEEIGDFAQIRTTLHPYKSLFRYRATEDFLLSIS